MPHVVLFDDPVLRLDLLPFTYTRPIALIRCGILTLTEKWQYTLSGTYSYLGDSYLREKYPFKSASDHLYINGSLIPDPVLLSEIRNLKMDEALYTPNEQLLAFRSRDLWQPGQSLMRLSNRIFGEKFQQISKKWHITQLNGPEISADLERLRESASFVPVSDPFTACYHPERIFIEEGAVVRASVLNAETGPIYIGKNAVVQEGSTIQGPFALGEGAILAQGTKIRPNTTVGPYCKAGGEINNSVMFSFSNKGHDGYLGSSVIGSWCNLGANTNNSNLKNDLSTVKLFNHATGEPEDTGLTHCGLYMGDYSKSGINTMFNTGTVVGVHVNVFGAGFQEKFIPSFTWGGKAEGYSTYRLEKALSVVEMTTKSKSHIFTDTDRRILEEAYKRSARYR